MANQTSEDWWEMHRQRVGEQIAQLGAQREDFMDSSEVGAVFGVGSEQLWGKPTQHCGNLPEPAFRTMRSKFWWAEDIRRWAKPWFDRQEEKRASSAAREARRAASAALRAERAEKHLTDQPPGASGFRGVRWHPYSSSFHTVLTLGNHQYQSLGYYKTAQEAARALDRVRLALGWPAVNFPDDTETTLAMPDPRNRPRVHRGGHRGLRKLIERVVLERGPLPVREIFEAVQAEGGDTTRGTVTTTLALLCRQGRIGRYAYGVYGPPL